MNPVLLERLNNMEEGELYYALFFDGVAKCYNRTAFELQPFKRVAIIDLDSLKWLNDTFGHRTGDYYLRQLAKELSSAFGSASVFRLSGDGFAVTCPSELYLVDKLRDVQSKVQYFSWVSPITSSTLIPNFANKNYIVRELDCGRHAVRHHHGRIKFTHLK